MKKLLNSQGVRVAAFLLFLVFGLTTAVCAVGFAYDMETGIGSGARNFPDSQVAQVYTYHQINYVFMNIDFAEYGYYQTPSGGFDDGFGYVVRDRTGKIVAENRLPGAVRAGRETVQHWDDESQEVDLIAECYVNLPTTPDTRLWDYVYLYDFLYDGWSVFLPLGLVAGVATLLLFVFLLAAAGRTPEGVKLGGLHRWPMEIYIVGLSVLGFVAVWALFEAFYAPFFLHLFYSLAMTAAAGLAVAAVVMLGLMDLAARWKTSGWWRNTVTYFCCKWGWRCVVWCWGVFLALAAWCWRTLKKVCSSLWRVALKSWKWLWGHVFGAARGVFRGASGLVRALPLTWKGLGIYTVLALVNFLIPFADRESGFILAQLLLVDAAGAVAVVWVAVQLKKLQAAGKALAAGDLDHTVDTARMLPTLREHGENLNAVGVGMTRAVDERMKSERFKTELITNVSHDLKTPLTSIVSYVDLLKKEDIDNEKAREYIQVLDRQSQRLKKLTTDLVEASKASSGVLAVNFEQVDLGEMLHQSAGEYAERFEKAKLDPVVTVPEGDWIVRADGRLVWRVLDNLLSNAVKYALPGTRVYLTVTRQEGRTVLAVKNISRDALNIPAEELMERFVRGDTSRSTDGSGLGLSIAQSLMELMGGRLQLTLDGDLFKAELYF